MQASPENDKIMTEIFHFVGTSGWTMDAIKQGAIQAGADPINILRTLNNDVYKAIEYTSNMIDRFMLAELEKYDFETIRVRDRVALGVMARFHVMARFKTAHQQTAKILSLPHNAPLSIRLIAKTIDHIWRAAGDQSTDFNFYTKRGLLSYAYSTSALFWLQDNSDRSKDTAAFLNRRLDEVMVIPKAKAKINTLINMFC